MNSQKEDNQSGVVTRKFITNNNQAQQKYYRATQCMIENNDTEIVVDNNFYFDLPEVEDTQVEVKVKKAGSVCVSCEG